jgi:hypothetical protein
LKQLPLGYMVMEITRREVGCIGPKTFARRYDAQGIDARADGGRVKRCWFRLWVRWQARLEQPVRLDEFLHRNRLWVRWYSPRTRRKPRREPELASQTAVEKAEKARQKAELAATLEQLRAKIEREPN